MTSLTRIASTLVRNGIVKPQFLVTRLVGTEAKPETTNLTLVSEANGIRTITLNNERKRNALSLAMLESLAENLVDNDSLRCIVINGRGPAFSAGHDLKELTAERGSQFHQQIFNFCSQVMLTIKHIPVPVIAQIDGVAAAAGCQLAAACDIVIATENSTFSTPGASAGLFCSTPGIAVARSANAKVAAYMVLTGIPITAQEALTSGLITKVVKKEELAKETERLTNAICSKSKSVIALGKRFFNEQQQLDLEDAYSQGSAVMVENLALKDGQAGVCAFINKTKPEWTHTWATVDNQGSKKS